MPQSLHFGIIIKFGPIRSNNITIRNKKIVSKN